MLQDNGHEILDTLLDDIYSHHTTIGELHTESDTITTASSALDASHYEHYERNYTLKLLSLKGVEELQEIRNRLSLDIAQASSKLVRILKQREITNRKVEQTANFLTAILHATSAKTAADAKLSFTLAASPGESGWQKWVDAMRAISRLPGGIPDQLRRKLWVGLADNYLVSNRIDWSSVSRLAFNEKSNPDDSALGLQIVKDLHRTGCSNSFLPANADVEVEKTLLKRVLLAYARHNKQVGYCQGFNVLATVILDTVDRNENDALKVMIYLIDHVLPTGYFSNCLRLLAVDLAVFRHLLALNLGQLANHLDKLQKKAMQTDSMEYEPPLTNVFLMQWLLTLYATCLPKQQLLRFWDCLLLNGSDGLLSAGLYIFTKLSKQIMACQTVDQFYSKMEQMVPAMRESKTAGSIAEADAFIQSIYKQLKPSVGELREQLLYSIQPFISSSLTGGLASSGSLSGPLDKDKDAQGKSSSSSLNIFGCVASTVCGRSLQHDNRDSYISGLTDEQIVEIGAVRERMTTDLRKLRRNYDRIQRNSAIVVIPTIDDTAFTDSAKGSNTKLGNALGSASKTTASRSSRQQLQQVYFQTTQSTHDVINHLLISKVGLDEVNQKILAAPILEFVMPSTPPQQQQQPATSPVPSSPYSVRRLASYTYNTTNESGIASSVTTTPFTDHGPFTPGFDECVNISSSFSLPLSSVSEEPTNDAKNRFVLSSLPSSPRTKQQHQLEEGEENSSSHVLITSSCLDSSMNLVEIDITSDSDLPVPGATFHSFSGFSGGNDVVTGDHHFGGSTFSRARLPTEDVENEEDLSYHHHHPHHYSFDGDSSGHDGKTSKQTFFDRFSFGRHLPSLSSPASSLDGTGDMSTKRGGELESSSRSPFPIPTAERLKKRLHLIPGMPSSTPDNNRNNQTKS